MTAGSNRPFVPSKAQLNPRNSDGIQYKFSPAWADNDATVTDRTSGKNTPTTPLSQIHFGSGSMRPIRHAITTDGAADSTIPLTISHSYWKGGSAKYGF